jgi:hypothetical protein
MGVYLSEPVTEKKVVEGSTKGYSFCCAEMQGFLCIYQKAGGKTCRMLPYTKPIWATETLSLQFLMAMEVIYSFYCIGPEVSHYV